MKQRYVLLAAISVAVTLAPACDSSGTVLGPAPRMTFDRSTDFFSAPFPSDDVKRADGTLDLSTFPNPNNIQLASSALQLITANAHGFAQSGGVFFSLTDVISASALPDMATTITASSPVFLMGVDPKAPDFGKRYPLYVNFAADGGDFGAPNLLSLVPLQGIPLRPGTAYAAVIRTELGVVPSVEMELLANGGRPAGLSDAAYATYKQAMAAVVQAGVPATDVAGLAAFTTDTPLDVMTTMRNSILSLPLPAPDSPWMANEVFDDYCVFSSTISMPDYQQGTEPYTNAGGNWAFDAQGNPLPPHYEESALYVTVPRMPMPDAGYPIVVFIRTGAGGNRPLVDRGAAATNGGPAIVPGSGPAMYFASEGYAGIQVDGPLGGLRNPGNWNEDFAIFNIFNPVALRDSVRESAIELVLFAHVLDGITLDASSCPGVSTTPVKFDTSNTVLMGHSMGSTISPLVAALEPRYKGVIMSGAGASWIENVLYKLQPLDVLPDIELLIDYTRERRALTIGDPVLTLFQWAEEPADPLIFTRQIIQEPVSGESPRQILMEQGIVDHYIMPRIANATSLSLGLDLAGTPLDGPAIATGGMNGELIGQIPLENVLTYSGRSQIPLPASANIGGKLTAIVIQHPADGIEDGHEIVFQTDPPKNEYRCFIAGLLAGVPPTIPMGTTALAPCP